MVIAVFFAFVVMFDILNSHTKFNLLRNWYMPKRNGQIFHSTKSPQLHIKIEREKNVLQYKIRGNLLSRSLFVQFYFVEKTQQGFSGVFSNFHIK